MAISGAAVAYATTGGLILYSGIKGATIADTIKGALGGTLAVADTETIGSPAATGSTGGGSGAVASGSAAAAQAYAKSKMASYGWTDPTDWNDLVSLWNQESGWNNTADNPSSGAYGIPQALPQTKMPTAAQAPPVGTSDAEAQIDWGLSYIQSTYGSPAMAWAHEQQNNWY